MSFRVNTNLMAMNTLRNLGTTNKSFSDSVTKLSTGLRINSGADDPAGLQISEGFRAQITGLSQALKNNQDAINYSKTAEGALNEVSQLLRDARALVLANGNDATLSAAQKQANQTQLTSIIQSIDRISQQTQFGQKKLLDGSAGVNATIVNKGKIESAMVGSTFGTSGTNTTINSNGNFDVQVTTAAVRATTTGNQAMAAAGALGLTGKMSINGISFSVTSDMTRQQVLDSLNSRSADTGVAVTVNGANQFVFTATKAGTSSNTIQISNDTAGLGFAAAGTRTLNSTTAGVDAVATFTFGSTNVSLTAQATDGRTFRDSYGNVIKLTEAGVVATDGAAVTSVIAMTAGNAQFQVGGNVGQTVNLSISNMGSSALGINALDITTSAGATTAMASLDAAIESVSTARGNIGNFTRNVLESNVRSLGVAKENITATESSIRDTDVAEEMTMYTKLQILQQSGISVLAQANQAPQAILSLLRG